MNLLDGHQARHFCRPLAAKVPGQAQSLKAFHDGIRMTRLDEGTPTFEAHRVSLLTAVERWLLFGVGHYRRALDMLIPGAAPWAHVTLYYASFFGANAILGMFGGWVDHSRVVEVERGIANQQALRIRRGIRSGPTGLQGSHAVFWDFFYDACNNLSPWVPADYQSLMTPVNNDRRWQTNNRNDVNYDTLHAHDAAILLHNSFNPKKLSSLAGPLRLQLELTEQMLKLAIYFADDFKVHSFGLDDYGLAGARTKVIRSVVTKAPPSLVQQSLLNDMFG